ncbi:MAG TPA: hypothetical protein VIT91_14225 [Chthoniobacterales bacterium]
MKKSLGNIQEYFEREVLPHVPRPLEAIESDIKQLEGEILALLKEVTA